MASSSAVCYPDDASLLQELGQLLKLAKEQSENGNYPKTIALCDTAEEVMRNNKYCSDTLALQELQLGLYFARAVGHVRCGNHAPAAEDLSKVIALDPEYDTAHAYRAGELCDLGLNTLAIDDYTVAIRLNS